MITNERCNMPYPYLTQNISSESKGSDSLASNNATQDTIPLPWSLDLAQCKCTMACKWCIFMYFLLYVRNGKLPWENTSRVKIDNLFE